MGYFVNVADKTIKGVKFFLVQPNSDMDFRFKGTELVEIMDYRKGTRIRQKMKLDEVVGPRGLYHIAYVRSLEALKSYIKDNGAYQREMYNRYRNATRTERTPVPPKKIKQYSPPPLREGEYAGMIGNTELYRAPTLSKARIMAVSYIPLNSNVSVDIWTGSKSGDVYVGSVRKPGNHYIFWSLTSVRVLDYNGNLK